MRIFKKSLLPFFVFFLFVLFFCDFLFALETVVHGRIQSTYVLRDTDGFQRDFLEDTEGVQWRNELKFDVTVKPEYDKMYDYRLEKIFLSYRGAYDAIFNISPDRYDIREKSPDDFELGSDDIKFENDLREAFIDFIADPGTQSVVLRIGRQIVQWGEADGFNVVNIVNPLDNSTLLFFENPEDLATPLWMGRLTYSKANLGPLNNVGLELVVVPDIRPHQFAPLDDNMDAPYAFTFKQMKDIKFSAFGGLSLNNIESFWFALPSIQGNAFQFKEDVPESSADTLEYGGKLQLGFGSFIGNIYYFHGYQDDPAMDFSELFTQNKLTFRHPEQDMYGLSFNCFLESINAVIKGEAALTDKATFVDLTDVIGLPIGSKGYVEKKVYTYLLGFDKDFWIKFINPNKMITTMWQVYWRRISSWDHDRDDRPFDKADNYRLTGYFLTDYWNGRIHPEIFFMFDPENVWMTRASIRYSKDGRLFYQLSQMSFWGRKKAISPFTQPVDLTATSEISFRIGYNW